MAAVAGVTPSVTINPTLLQFESEVPCATRIETQSYFRTAFVESPDKKSPIVLCNFAGKILLERIKMKVNCAKNISKIDFYKTGGIVTDHGEVYSKV